MLKTANQKVFIDDYACRTAFGTQGETLQSLLRNEIALRPVDVLGRETPQERVPLALTSDMQDTLPVRWWAELQTLLESVPGDLPWGTLDYPVIVTSSNFGIDSLYYYTQQSEQTKAPELLQQSIAHQSVDKIAQSQSWGKNVCIFSHACVSAHLGLYHAAQLLHNHQARKVLLVSYDYLSPFVTGGFHALKILNEFFPAPYQLRETGAIGLGDGAAWMVLSREPSAFCVEHQLLYNEMYHFTSNEPQGSGFAAIAQGLKAVIQDRRIWIKGHGTGTLEAGKLEAEQFGRCFPDSPLVSWKGSIGHTLGSCALIELVIACEAIRAGTCPGTVGSSGPCYSDQVATESFSNASCQGAIIASNAFGGAHAALFLSHD